ncbi:MAG: hypothetical protein AAGH83_05020 [Pseudomonadota bacterium]
MLSFYMLLFELLALVLAAGLAVLRPAPVRRLLDGIAGWFGPLASRPALVIALPGLSLLIVRLALLPVFPFPGTVGRDESSLLLAAETMLQGRLAMPPHALPQFFESVYVNHIDAYNTIYFPGRVLEVALGLGLFGEPGFGVLIVAALAASAITWALRPWVSPGWALVGGMLFVVRFGMFSNLVNQPIGLAGIVLGGALLVGGYGRLRQEITWGPAVATALGLLLLAISRPFEGFLVALPFALGLLIAQRRTLFLPPTGKTAVVFVPVLAAVAIAAAILATFNLAATGSMFQTSYGLSREAYAGTPAFWLSDAVSPSQVIPDHLAAYYQLEGQRYWLTQTPEGIAKSIAGKAFFLWRYYLGFLLIVPFVIGLRALIRDWPVLASLVTFFAGFSLVQFNWPHYAMPILPILMLIVVAGLEAMDRFGPSAAVFARLILPVSALLLLVPLVLLVTGRQPSAQNAYHPCCYLYASKERDALEAMVLAEPGPHVIYVRYGADESGFRQWVYNGANLDSAEVLWVNDLGAGENRRLIAHYPDHRHWLLDGTTAGKLQAMGSDGAPVAGEYLALEGL